MSDMKIIMENWRQSKNLNEEERVPAEKAEVLRNAETESDLVINKINAATGEDKGLKREVLQSIIAKLQAELAE